MLALGLAKQNSTAYVLYRSIDCWKNWRRLLKEELCAQSRQATSEMPPKGKKGGKKGGRRGDDSDEEEKPTVAPSDNTSEVRNSNA